jgi:hypothetical protein
MNPNSTLHVIVASYTWGKDAGRLDGMSHDAIVTECLKARLLSPQWVENNLTNIHIFCTDICFSPHGTTLTALLRMSVYVCSRMSDGLVSSNTFSYENSSIRHFAAVKNTPT